MALTLLRHTTPAIASGVCYGMTDLDVADTFAVEARDVVAALPPPDRIATSPLTRCRLLAEHIGEAMNLPVTIDERLREMDFGAWEGLPWSDIPRAELDQWATDFLHARPHGGESVAMLTARVHAALAKWDDHQSHALIVTHAGVIKAALANEATAQGYNTTIGFGRFITLREEFLHDH
ncbi:alpha-ribazole phosphatase [Hyphomonas chukchiensis]|uniref:alpha-ribazole phosphatase n=1 Tax=Hyphomonas chukchiensis TaxID=1280947 RepID=UPI0030F9CCFA